MANLVAISFSRTPTKVLECLGLPREGYRNLDKRWTWTTVFREIYGINFENNSIPLVYLTKWGSKRKHKLTEKVGTYIRQYRTRIPGRIHSVQLRIIKPAKIEFRLQTPAPNSEQDFVSENQYGNQIPVHAASPSSESPIEEEQNGQETLQNFNNEFDGLPLLESQLEYKPDLELDDNIDDMANCGNVCDGGYEKDQTGFDYEADGNQDDTESVFTTMTIAPFTDAQIHYADRVKASVAKLPLYTVIQIGEELQKLSERSWDRFTAKAPTVTCVLLRSFKDP